MKNWLTMDHSNDYSKQLQQELEALPRDYTEIMARRNRDIVNNTMLTFNIGRFLVFLDNFNTGIPDKIRITNFGVDGPPTVKILFYDGNLLTFVVDATRYQSSNFYTFYGKDIAVNKRDMYEDVILDYNLITLDQKEIPVLSIWAGFHPLD